MREGSSGERGKRGERERNHFRKERKNVGEREDSERESEENFPPRDGNISAARVRAREEKRKEEKKREKRERRERGCRGINIEAAEEFGDGRRKFRTHACTRKRRREEREREREREN